FHLLIFHLEAFKMSEITTAFFASNYEDIDEMLERAKENPHHIPVDFNTRFRVFRDQIVPDRLQELHKSIAKGEKTDPFVNRTMKDISNLYKRLEKEFMVGANDRRHTRYLLIRYQAIYNYHKAQLLSLTKHYFNQVNRIEQEYTPLEVEII
ncbi:MAG: hypothetical protein NWE90_07400, partial [Candidatus Bathyarchaeota archaeon]|nr:hypothetical protein [Candidatus Bathyarchaeota archaeon]